MSEHITLEEQQQVLDEAIKLIKEPASWTTGEWKCDLYETDEKGELIEEKDGSYRRARDLYNRPLSQYCIEGAVNQAVYNILGEDRARELGAYDEIHEFEGNGEDATVWPTDLLGIDDLAREKYAEICGGEDHAALHLNDYHSGDDDKTVGHKKILGLLKTRRTQIKKALSKKSKVSV